MPKKNAGRTRHARVVARLTVQIVLSMARHATFTQPLPRGILSAWFPCMPIVLSVHVCQCMHERIILDWPYLVWLESTVGSFRMHWHGRRREYRISCVKLVEGVCDGSEKGYDDVSEICIVLGFARSPSVCTECQSACCVLRREHTCSTHRSGRLRRHEDSLP